METTDENFFRDETKEIGQIGMVTLEKSPRRLSWQREHHFDKLEA